MTTPKHFLCINLHRNNVSCQQKENETDNVIDEFLDNLELEGYEVVEEVEASENELDEDEIENWEDYQSNKILRLKEENLLLIDQSIFMKQKMEVLCHVMNLEKGNFEKVWDFFKETLS